MKTGVKTGVWTKKLGKAFGVVIHGGNTNLRRFRRNFNRVHGLPTLVFLNIPVRFAQAASG